MTPALRLILVVALSMALAGGLALSLIQGSGGTTGPVTTSQPGFFGIAQGIRLDARDFQLMRATGVKTDRFLLFWEAVQPQPGSFEWGPTDGFMGAFASHGVRPFPPVSGTPEWVPGVSAGPPLDSPEAE